MISFETKAESTSSSPIGLSVAEDEPEISFSELLKGVKTSKDDKVVQNGILVLDIATENTSIMENKVVTGKDTLLSLLKENTTADNEDFLEFNPKIAINLSPKDMQALVVDAKGYLKSKIIDSDGYKRSLVKDLPKTLKGLTDMAKNFGIDVSKITLQEVKSAKPTLEMAKKINLDDTKQELKSAKPTLEMAKRINLNDTKEEKITVSSKESLRAESDIDIIETKPKTLKIKSVKAQVEQDVVGDIKVKDNIRVDDKKVETIKEIKGTPLFKAQEKVELTTEQLVQTKQFKVEDKTAKDKADETLKLLLRGEKSSQTSQNLTADFSVATAKVLAPKATSEVSKSLEQLLHGESQSDSTSTSKTDALNVHKSDSFEVKINEAKQMIKYLSQDVKTAIEDYKSPFTRVKIQLNPQKLGEVDLTVVQRGKNLHINISSNNTAINTLSMNANELRVQLNNSGINNASLNFNNSSQNSEQNASQQQQQHRQNEREATKEYNYFDNEEENEEILSSLEIVVPNYA